MDAIAWNTSGLPVPLWAVALVLAALSPMGVRAFNAHLERRLKARTAAVLARLPVASAGEPYRGANGTPGLVTRDPRANRDI